MKCKCETDERHLDDAGKEAARLQAVKMVVKNLDINRRTSYGWLDVAT